MGDRGAKRVFLNHIDLYSSKWIGKFLSNCVAGESLEEAGEAEASEDERSSPDALGNVKDGTFEIVGTLLNEDKKKDKKATFALEEYLAVTQEQLLPHLMKCDVIIYNISEDADQIDEASWAVSALHAELDNFDHPKMFILVSTLLTWALSKSLDPVMKNEDDPDVPFTEEDYRKRRPHPNFKDHISVEKLVIKMGKTNKSKLSTYVVASGLQYGMGENLFHFFFKMSWLGEVSRIPVFGPGNNILPTIHVNDLAGLLQNVIDHQPKIHYLVGVDDSKNSFEDIVKAISSAVGPGKIQNVPKEDIFLTQNFTQNDIDSLFMNLRIEAIFLKENFNLNWVSETGIVENIDLIVEEYRRTRGLLPLRVCVFGPPAVGKSTVAEKICKQYKLHHIKLKDTITESIAQLVSSSVMHENHIGMEDVESESDESANEAQEFLATLKENMEQNAGRLDDQFVIQIMADKLQSQPCKNQGFVLDGFPKTYEQAKELFAANEDEAEETNSKIPTFNKKMIPEFVFSLEASDAFLINRVMNLPESVVQGTHLAQEPFLRHLTAYRDVNTEDETVLNYFDELEIHPEQTGRVKVCKILGKPRNYGPTKEEQELQEQRAAAERLRQMEAEKAEAERKEAEEAADRAARWEEWSNRLAEVRQQEEELLEAQSVPLRNYLMKNVMPTLTQGLIQCCRLKPDDPVDFLAEYLFRNRPEID
uniref:Adenylate kinase 7a n=1 Tax=Scleropages formosus TaxID=113540 RepID=A0A8C9TEV8_SCLFO